MHLQDTLVLIKGEKLDYWVTEYLKALKLILSANSAAAYLLNSPEAETTPKISNKKI